VNSNVRRHVNVRQADLKVHGIYFGVAYEDDAFTLPIIRTYEYLGETSGVAEAPFLFRFVGSDDELHLSERQLEHVIDAAELIALLARFRDGKPMHERHAS
jgi:hypothetical protein